MSDERVETGCGCKTSEQTGTLNGYMCPWHRDRYITALARAERERGEITSEKEKILAELLRCLDQRDEARAEVERLKEELDDSNGAYRDVMKEACAGGVTYDTDDRLHCTCVPHLREGVKALQADLARTRAALEYVRQVTAGERSDDFSDDEEPIIAMNIRARAALEGRG